MFIVDTHCDTLLALSQPHAEPRKEPEPDVTPERLRSGGVSLQVCALFSGSHGPAAQGWKAPRAMADAEYAVLGKLTGAGIRQVDSPFEVGEGEHCLMLSIEGGEIIGTSLEDLRSFRKLGVRLFSLTWNFENELAYPHCDGGQHGLKPFGWEAVKEMDRLGIGVDVSHLGEGGFWDLIFHAEHAPLATHSCCRKLRNHTRNLTDDQIRALIDCGGWMGINFYTEFLTDTGRADVETVVDHIAHVADLGGVSIVGFGSDFDGIDRAPAGLTHPGEMPNLLSALTRRGFSQQEIEGIAGENFRRYMRQFEKA